jgi:orotate phosphoribosyltransferase-like protein
MRPRSITEAEFIAYEDMQLAEFARLIHESGISLYEIAQNCNLSWETVKAAANATPVKFSSQCRIKMYIEWKQKSIKKAYNEASTNPAD